MQAQTDVRREVRFMRCSLRLQRVRWREQAWLLKNSFGVFPQKTRRARMPYKPFSLRVDTFLVTDFRLIFGKPDFFNSHGRYRQLRARS